MRLRARASPPSRNKPAAPGAFGCPAGPFLAALPLPPDILSHFAQAPFGGGGLWLASAQPGQFIPLCGVFNRILREIACTGNFPLG